MMFRYACAGSTTKQYAYSSLIVTLSRFSDLLKFLTFQSRSERLIEILLATNEVRGIIFCRSLRLRTI